MPGTPARARYYCPAALHTRSETPLAGQHFPDQWLAKTWGRQSDSKRNYGPRLQLGNFGLAGSLDLSGFNQAVNGLTDLGLTNGITNSASAGVTNIITIGLNTPSNSLTYSGLIVITHKPSCRSDS